jgi:glycosyltransferase involved in cell wall biosynthesis
VRRKKLIIISHTEHFSTNGQITGWGPTVNEIDHLADHWEEVIHVACLHPGEAPPSSRPYTRANVRFVPIDPTGGKNLRDKPGIIFQMPAVLRKVARAIRGASHVQFRAPTGIGVFLLPAFSFLFRRDFVFWVKYAGDWGARKPAASYRFQRWWLKKNYAACPVTINGSWPGQPEHCISFENPCLTEEELSNGKLVQEQKRFNGPFRLAFVGRLENEKGVDRIVEALKCNNLRLIETMDFVGDGPKRRKYEEQCSALKGKAVFHGFLDKAGVHRILSKAHFFILPSTSEGFPKVIAEAACYGGIPVVSDVGSIGQFVKDGTNGFLWKPTGTESFMTILERALSSDAEDLKLKSTNVCRLAGRFTFDHYRRNLELHVLDETLAPVCRVRSGSTN